MLLKIKEVADRMRVEPRTIIRRIHEGNLPAIKFGRFWRIRADALNNYLEENETNNKPPLGGLPGRE